MSPVAVTNLSFCSDSSIAGLLSDPLTVLVYDGVMLLEDADGRANCEDPTGAV